MFRIGRPILAGAVVLSAGLGGIAWLRADSDPDDVAASLKREIGGGASARRVGPFVVGGDLDAEAFDRAADTIARAHGAFRKQFFAKDADRDIRVYLFPDAASYEAYCRRGLGHDPASPYGFYLPERRALVMNIGTGTGTLVHEMVHALIAFDFPDVPAWFNEGFASLFEQCTTADDRIRGLVNWRLKGLQKGLGEGAFLPFRSLASFTGPEFYGEGSGFRYAEARYLCLYLQEKGRLEAFYRKIRDDHAKDPTGYAALASAFDRPIGEVEAEFVTWAKGLRLGPR